MIADILAKVDESEKIRDQIAGIIALEAGTELRVFLERANPWGEYVDAPDLDDVDATPIVNVSYDSGSFDMRASSTVDRQHATSTYHVDCYAYAVSSFDAVSGGHISGDEAAALAAMRAMRIARNILMSGKYTYLGLPRGTVWRRWVDSISLFQPQLDARAVQSIAAGRLTFRVDHNEFAPQVAGEPLVVTVATMRRSPAGEVLFTAEF